MACFHEAHLAVVGEQVELSSAAADLMDTAGPWEVAGRRDSELTGMHLSTTLTHIEDEGANCLESYEHFLGLCACSDPEWALQKGS